MVHRTSHTSTLSHWLVYLSVICGLLVAAPSVASSQESGSGEEEGADWVEFTLATEIGFIDVVSHRLQQDSDGTYFDYVEQGGQEIFFPFWRMSAEFAFSERHNLIFLYQPLDLRSQVRLDRDVVVDGGTFSEGTAVDLRYGFDFYRLTYHYDLAPSPDLEIGVGGGFQMRDAVIVFTAVDGSLRRDDRDLGPVPLLKFRGRLDTDSGAWFGTEIDGFYASSRIINGSTESSFSGAILDANLRAGATLSPGLDAFLNLRYLGGGGDGDSPDDPTEPGDGFTRNWLHTVTLSLGFYFTPQEML
jgi:hypothetical protein